MLELALYNAVISGVSLDGEAFFYDNPLASDGTHHRQGWFSCPCCPPNLARLLASLGDYVYAQSDTEAVVHLYVQGAGQFQLGGQSGDAAPGDALPLGWRGGDPGGVEQPARFGLRLRLPGWCAAPRLTVNGAPVDLAGTVEDGYARIERDLAGWRRGCARPADAGRAGLRPPGGRRRRRAVWRCGAGRSSTVWSRPTTMCRSTGSRCRRRPS